MKIRQGFVSNSSSSSFLIVGYRAPQKEIDCRDELEIDWRDKTTLRVCDIGDGEKVIGLVRTIGEYESSSMPLSWVTDAVDKLKKAYGKDIEIEIFFGVREQ